MTSGLRVAVQMDPLASIDLDNDSTFALMLEAQNRGHTLYHYGVNELALVEGSADRHQGRSDRLFARAHPVTVKREMGKHYSFGDGIRLNLGKMDVVLMRQDPPFDMAYITATHLLEHIHPKTLVVNDPCSVRNAPEKLLVTHFPDLMPPTLISWSTKEMREFRTRYEDIIVKPLFGNGGAGIFRIKPGDENFSSLLEMHFARSREPLMLQRYEEAVRIGDKRIILVDGEPKGAINRIPADGDARSNMHVGGRAVMSSLTQRDREICERIGPTLRDQGLLFVGIDVIGDWLTEINVTSPTGIETLRRLGGQSIAPVIWDKIESIRNTTSSYGGARMARISDST